jgi:hypothetical protein
MAKPGWLDYFAGSALPAGLQSAGGPVTVLERLAAALASIASGTNPDGTSLALPVVVPAPAAANILAGQAAVTATQAAATFLTIPQGRTWQGTITMNCSVANAAAGTALSLAEGVVSISGAGATPAAGPLMQVDALAAPNAVAGLSGTQGNNAETVAVTIAAGGAPALLQLAATVSGTTTGRVNVTAAGLLF